MTTEPRTTADAGPPRPAAPVHRSHRGVEAEVVDATYLAQRRLRTGTAGWLLLAGLGVSAVISGDDAGWTSARRKAVSAVCSSRPSSWR